MPLEITPLYRALNSEDVHASHDVELTPEHFEEVDFKGRTAIILKGTIFRWLCSISPVLDTDLRAFNKKHKTGFEIDTHRPAFLKGSKLGLDDLCTLVTFTVRLSLKQQSTKVWEDKHILKTST